MPADVVFGEVWYEPGGRLGPRFQDDLQFVIVHRGSAEITVDGQTRKLPADRVACLRPGHRESFQFDRRERTRHSWVAMGFDADADEEVGAALEPVPWSLGLTRRMQMVLDTGLELWRGATPADRPILRHLAVAFFHAYVAAIEAEREKPVPESVARARRFIHERHADPIDLERIADAAHMSGNHLVRLFKQHLGVTPVRYLWTVRAERGADLLRGTGLSISEIAYRVGFATPYHFSRVIKRRFGVAPRRLREARWSGRDAE